MREPTTLSSWAAAIAAALHAHGIDARSLLLQAGLDPEQVGLPGARYPARAMTHFWQLAVDATHPALSLEVPAYVQPDTMHALGESLQASRTLEEALLRMARYARLVTDAADMVLELQEDSVQVIYRRPCTDLPLADAAFEAFMASAVQLTRHLSGRHDGLLHCTFNHAPPTNTQPYEDYFACPVRFGAADNRLCFERQRLRQPLPTANDHTTRHYDSVAAEYLARFDAQPTCQRVREQLIRLLPSGEPTREAIAAQLHLTPRTLLRRLASEGTHWKALLNEVRQELACSYLRQGRGAAEITYRLGFANPSNFTRAFRRWTGQAPSQWRATELTPDRPDTPY